jgi:hypothetical protein
VILGFNGEPVKETHDLVRDTREAGRGQGKHYNSALLETVHGDDAKLIHRSFALVYGGGLIDQEHLENL